MLGALAIPAQHAISQQRENGFEGESIKSYHYLLLHFSGILKTSTQE
jgi:hypothetical protein